MANEAKALVTTIAKQRLAEMFAYGTSYRVKYFEVSAGGHDPTDPTTALAADASWTEIPGTTLFGPEPIDGVEWEVATCPIFVCTIEQGEYTGDLSSVGLIAEIVYVGFDVAATASRTFTFNDNSPSADTIVCSAGSFISDGFAAGMYITVSGTMLNDGFYQISTVTATAMTLTTTATLTAEGPITAGVITGGWHPDPPVLGEQFLFAVYNRPRATLTSTDGPTTFRLMPFF